MRSPRRLAVVVALAAAVLISSALVSQPAVATPPTPKLPLALQNLRTCVSGSGRLDVLFLTDESSSLGGQGHPGTDPNGARVAGIRAGITGLERLAQSAAHQLSVHVLLMGFADTVNTAPSFSSTKVDKFSALTSSTVPRLLAEAGSFAARDHGVATDYTLALTAARTALAKQAAQETVDGVSPCQAVIFFTDGQYTTLGNPQRGYAALCNSGGVTDLLRSDGVELLTIALSSELATGDAQFLHEMTDGTGPTKCGSTASPANGYVVLAADDERLIFLFSNLFTTDGPPMALPGSFTVAPGVDGMVVSVAASAGTSVTMTATDGSSYAFKLGASGVGAAGGFNLSTRPLAPDYSEVDGQASGVVAPGTWHITAGGASALFTYSLSSSARPSLAGPAPAVVPGGTVQVPLVLKMANGSPIPAGALADGAQISASVQENGVGPETAVPVTRSGSAFELSLATNAASTASRYVITAQAILPDLDGTPVAGQSATFKLLRGLASGVKITSTGLIFHTLSGTKPSVGQVTIQGDPNSSACVWFTDLTLTPPPNTGQPTVLDAGPSTQAGCLVVPAGQSATATFRIKAAKATFGRLTGSIVAHISSSGDKKIDTVTLPVQGRFSTPTDVVSALWKTVLLMIAGCLLPLLLLHGLNLRVGRFTSPKKLRIWSQDVRVTEEGFASTVPPFEAADINIKEKVVGNASGAVTPVRRMTIRPVEFAAVASGSWQDRTLRVFRGPYGTATYPGAIGGTSLARFRNARRGDRLEVPLAITGFWFFAPISVDSSGTRTGKLTIIAPDNIDDDDDLAADSELKRVVSRAHSAASTTEFPGLAEVEPDDSFSSGSEPDLGRSSYGSDPSPTDYF